MSAVKGWRSAAPAAVATVGLLLAGCTGATPAAGPSRPQTPAQAQPANATGSGPAAASSGTATGGTAAGDGSTAAGGATPGAIVALRINTPRSGQTVALPAPVSYTVTGLQFGSSAGYHLRVQIGQPVSYTLDLPISGPSGTVDLPVDKNLPGNRTLTFSLTRGDNFAVTGPQGAVIVRDVTITGLR